MIVLMKPHVIKAIKCRQTRMEARRSMFQRDKHRTYKNQYAVDAHSRILPSNCGFGSQEERFGGERKLWIVEASAT